MSNKVFIKNALFYSFFTIFQKSISFFLLPLYTYFLSPDEYGIIGVITSVVGFLSIFTSMGLNHAMIRFYSKYENEDRELRKFVGSMLIIAIIIVSILAFLLFIFRRWIFLPILDSIPFFPFMYIGLFSITFRPLYTLYLSFLQAKQVGLVVVKINMLFFVFNLVQVIIFLVFLKIGPVSLILSMACTNILFGIYGVVKLYKFSHGKFSIFYIKQALIYSLPLVPNNLGLWTMAMVDRLVLNKYLGTVIVGLYYTGSQFSNLIGFIVGSIQSAYTPWFFNKIEENDLNGIKKIAELLIVFYSFIAVVISLFIPEIFTLIVADEYYDGWKIVPFLCFAFVLQGMYSTWYNVILLKWVKFAPVITIISAFLNFFLNIILVNKWGIIGAAVASMMSKLLVSIISLVVAEKIMIIGFNWKKMYTITFLSFFISITVFLFQSCIHQITIRVGLKIIVVFITSFIIYINYKQIIKRVFFYKLLERKK